MLIICARCARRNATEYAQCESCESPLALTLGTRFVIDGEEFGLGELLGELPKMRKKIALLQGEKGEIAPPVLEKKPVEQPAISAPPAKKEAEAEELPRILRRDFRRDAQGQNADYVAFLLQELEQALQLAQATRRKEQEDRLFADADFLENLLDELRAKEAAEKANLAQAQAQITHTQEQQNFQERAAEQQMESSLRAKIMMLSREMGELEDAIRRAQKSGNKDSEALLRTRLQQAQMRLELLRAGKSEVQEQAPLVERQPMAERQAIAEKVEKVQVLEKERQKLPIKPAEPSAFELAVQQFFAPLRSAAAFVSQQYEEAKAQQRLPLFFMTLAGIVILLFGLGFLVQYSANTWFGNLATQAKAGVGFAMSLAILGTGVMLTRRKEDFRLFGTALIGLSLSITYLLIYYLSSSAAVAAAWGFGLIALNSLFSSALAIGYRSGLVATLGLVAGAFSPLYLQQTGATPLFYFGYLWLLCLAAVATAQYFRWAALPVVSWLLSSIILVFSVYRNVWLLPLEQYAWAVVVVFHAFAYLHWAAALLHGGKWRERQDAFSLSMLAAGSLVLAGLLFGLLGNPQLGGAYMGTLALLYALNALPFLAGLAMSRLRGREDMFFDSAMLLIGAFFVGSAVFSYVDATRWGLLLGLESLLVLALALMLNLRTVQTIAAAGLALSVLLVVPTFSQIGAYWQQTLWTQGFVNLLYVGAMLSALLFLSWRFADRLSEASKSAFAAVTALWAVWVSSVWAIVWAFYANLYMYPSMGVLVLAFISLGAYRRNLLVEVFGWLHLLAVAYGVMLSMEAVGSPRFPMQLLYAKVGMIAIVLLLGLLQDFYKYALKGRGEGGRVAYVAREVFFWILPLALVDMSRNNFPEYWVLGIWAGATLAMFLREWTQRRSLVFLVHFTVFSAAILTLWQGSWLGAGVGVGLLWLWWATGKAYDEAAYLQRKSDWVLFAFAGYFPVLVALRWYLHAFQPLETWLPVAGALSIFAFGFYFAAGQTWAAAWRKLAGLHFRIGYISLMLAFFWLAGFRGSGVEITDRFELFLLGETKFLSLAALALGLLSYIVYTRSPRLYAKDNDSLWQAELVFVQILYIALYAALVLKMFGSWQHAALTVLAFLHAIALVFVALRPAYKFLTKFYIPVFALALIKLFFIDLARAETVIKIVVFIGLGLLFLAAAFLFIKLNKGAKKEEEEQI